MWRRVVVSAEEHRKVVDFCTAIAAKQAGRNSRDRMRGDVGSARFTQGVIGKLGEVAVASLTGGTVDFSVWSTGSRGLDQFEPDIPNPTVQPFGGKRIHVKTCNAKYARSPSWTVDVSDPIRTTPTAEDVLVLALANESPNVDIVGWLPATDALPHWKECYSPHMAHKRAIYMGDVRPLIRNLE